jgi:non-ribosomal peptide synthetase component F
MRGSNRNVAHVASFTFDGSWEPLIWMLAGHTLHVLDDDEYRDDVALVGYVRRHGVDVLDVTPTYLRQLVPAGVLDAGLSTLLVGGEAIDPHAPCPAWTATTCTARPRLRSTPTAGTALPVRRIS